MHGPDRPPDKWSVRISYHLRYEAAPKGRFRKRKSSKKQTNKVPVRNAARPHSHHVKLRDAGGGSQSEKREWEVGSKGGYDDIDDGRNLKR